LRTILYEKWIFFLDGPPFHDRMFLHLVLPERLKHTNRRRRRMLKTESGHN